MDQHPATKAAPSSDLSARQETALWAVADVIFIVVLVLLSIVFIGEGTTSLDSRYVLAPIIGWVIGNVAAFAVPRQLTVPSWVVLVAGLVVVVACALIFSSHAIAAGRGIAGFTIGMCCGFLLLRALTAGHRVTAGTTQGEN